MANKQSELTARIAGLRALREQAEIPTWKLRVNTCGICRDDGGEFDIYPVDRGYHGLLKHRGDAEFIVAAANEALPLLSELEEMYRRSQVAHDAVNNAFHDTKSKLETAEAENRRLREALEKLREAISREDMPRSSEVYLQRIIEAALADKGGTNESQS